MFVSHLGCAALGVAALAAFGPGWVARAFALAAAIAFMQYTGSLHPPGTLPSPSPSPYTYLRDGVEWS